MNFSDAKLIDSTFCKVPHFNIQKHMISIQILKLRSLQNLMLISMVSERFISATIPSHY